MSERDSHSGHRLFDVAPELLRRVAVLSTLSDEELAELTALCDGLFCMPGQCLVGRADPTRSVFFILEGRVKIVDYSASDREVLFREMSAGEMFGELAAISGEPRSAGVWVLEETRVARLSSLSFWQLMSTNTAVMRSIMQHLAELVYALSKRVFEHDSLKVESRIHSQLLRLGRERGVERNRAIVDPAPTQGDIGKLVGTNRHAVNKELKKLEQAGIIETSRQRIALLDVDALENLLHSGCHAGRYTGGDTQFVDTSAHSRPSGGDRHTSVKPRSPMPERGSSTMDLWDQVLRGRRRQDC